MLIEFPEEHHYLGRVKEYLKFFSFIPFQKIAKLIVIKK